MTQRVTRGPFTHDATDAEPDQRRKLSETYRTVLVKRRAREESPTPHHVVLLLKS